MRIVAICPHCELKFEYVRGAGAPRKYCSRQCQCDAYEAKRRSQTSLSRNNLICVQCSRVFDGAKATQKYCSYECRYRANHQLSKVGFEMKCLRCNKSFIARNSVHKFCSRTCKRAGYSTGYRERAKHFGVEYDGSLTLPRAIQKFGLICAECRELILATHSDRPNPDGPSLDHVVPMSMGGGHVWSNVEIVHMSCNALRYRRMRSVVVVA